VPLDFGFQQEVFLGSKHMQFNEARKFPELIPQNVQSERAETLAISRFVWVDWFPVMRGTHQMLWCRVRLAGG
jgi:hypothetical protein